MMVYKIIPMRATILFITMFFALSSLYCYQWPANGTINEWFLAPGGEYAALGIKMSNVNEVNPFHEGEIIFFDNPELTDSIPGELDSAVTINHDELTALYGVEGLAYSRTQGTNFMLKEDTVLFSSLDDEDSADRVLYFEIFNHSSNQIINPALLLPENKDVAPIAPRIDVKNTNEQVVRRLGAFRTLPIGNALFTLAGSTRYPLKASLSINGRPLKTISLDTVEEKDGILLYNGYPSEAVFGANGEISLGESDLPSGRINITLEYVDIFAGTQRIEYNPFVYRPAPSNTPG